jgi:hypothetical protein
VDEQWGDLSDLESLDEVHLVRRSKFQSLIPLFTEFKERKFGLPSRKSEKGGDGGAVAEDLNYPVANSSNPDSAAGPRISNCEGGFAQLRGVFEDTVLVERIREVRALLGFTRMNLIPISRKQRR